MSPTCNPSGNERLNEVIAAYAEAGRGRPRPEPRRMARRPSRTWPTTCATSFADPATASTGCAAPLGRRHAARPRRHPDRRPRKRRPCPASDAALACCSPGCAAAVPGYEILGELGAAAWASSTRPGRSSLNRARGPEDDPGRRPRRRRRSWPASAPRPRRSPACSTRTSCRSTRSASTTACRSSRWSSAAGGSLAAEARRHAAAADARRPRLVETLARAMHAAHQAGRRPPRPEAGQRPAGPRDGHARRSPTSAWPRSWTTATGQTPVRARSWARPATWPRSRPAATARRSARRRTSTPWGRSCTSC